MEFSEFLSEFKSSFKQYDTAGLIEDMDIHSWVVESLRRFGHLPTIATATTVHIKNRKGSLPEGFNSLKLAVKCELSDYECEEEDKDILLDYSIRKEISTNDIFWNSCNPCDREVKQSFIEEKVYLSMGKEAKFIYTNIQPLKLVSYLKKDVDSNDCFNLKIKNSPYEISINNGTLYTNFTNGTVYIVYNGFEMGEDGFIRIPESLRGHVKSYVEYYCKRKFMERLIESGDATANESTLLQYYTNLELQHFGNAKTDLKFKDMNMAIDAYKESLGDRFKMYNFGL